MSWRTVVISSRCKLDTKMGYMVVRGEELRRIFLDEIAVLIIENPAVALTGCLLSELLERFVRTVSAHGYRVLLLDHVEGKKFPMERRLTIDKDLCEF